MLHRECTYHQSSSCPLILYSKYYDYLYNFMFGSIGENGKYFGSIEWLFLLIVIGLVICSFMKFMIGRTKRIFFYPFGVHVPQRLIYDIHEPAYVFVMWLSSTFHSCQHHNGKFFTFLFFQQDKGQPLPKFGEWDVNDPASAEGFTVIFNKARDEKKTGGNPGSPGKVDPQSKPGVDPGKPPAVSYYITSLSLYLSPSTCCWFCTF